MKLHIITRYPTELNKGYLKKFLRILQHKWKRRACWWSPIWKLDMTTMVAVCPSTWIKYWNWNNKRSWCYYVSHGSVLCICARISEGAEVLGTWVFDVTMLVTVRSFAFALVWARVQRYWEHDTGILVAVWCLKSEVWSLKSEVGSLKPEITRNFGKLFVIYGIWEKNLIFGP